MMSDAFIGVVLPGSLRPINLALAQFHPYIVEYGPSRCGDTAPRTLQKWHTESHRCWPGPAPFSHAFRSLFKSSPGSVLPTLRTAWRSPGHSICAMVGFPGATELQSGAPTHPSHVNSIVAIAE